MTKVLDMLIALRGGPDKIAKGSGLGQLMKARGVAKSNDFTRVSRLPRRVWEEAPDLEELIFELTAYLRLSGREELWPVQAAAIRDAHDCGGAFLPIGVGRGKTFISLLAPTVVECDRPVLFVPAALRDQTNRILPHFRDAWKVHPNLRIVGYSELSLEKNAEMLWKLRPDLIIADECHRLKWLSSGRTKRVARYMNDEPSTKFIAMSGTVSKKSIKDFAHIALWCLKKGAPVPISWSTLGDWANAIDADVDEDQQRAPGVLTQWCAEGENVRVGWQRRLNETPGVVNSPGIGNVNASLRVVAWNYKPPSVVLGAITKLAALWETPNGDVIAEASDIWRHARELALGFWYRWDPAAPRDWMIARSAWKSYVRYRLRTNRSAKDTELQVWNETQRWAKEGSHRDQNKLDAIAKWEAWRFIRDSFKPNTVATWITGQVVDAAAAWLAETDGIVWVEHIAFGQQLARAASVPYFGAGNSDILDHRGACIASIQAHGEGKNLHQHSRALILAPPSAGKTWEQLLGRHHREKQEADEVLFEVFIPCTEILDSFNQALSDARYLEDTLGQDQKLCFCDLDVPGAMR